ncbi:MAG: 2-amino-4-hydroxy-6-hydroxymethyldihydropteridine diphosphokinase [Deltaproteobacteria bacterium HGW-Deltaproteobacteria-8]|nr:MAG: 2-amino-4-hydroxy-6-hydroxymethyldihydropteridine diphosphokinase [Deltaproteobacteria bacterium HGW-Deltaproteobacteria-8]
MALGSNIGDGEANINDALTLLEDYGNDISFGALSHIYRTDPQGDVKDQPWFSNAVVRLEIASDVWAPEGFLSTIQAIEVKMGRLRGMDPGGPRIIDLDLLLFGDTEMDSDYLTLPHPRMLKRAFVLVPLREVAPKLVFKDGRTIDQVLSGLNYTLDGLNIAQK